MMLLNAQIQIIANATNWLQAITMDGNVYLLRQQLGRGSSAFGLFHANEHTLVHTFYGHTQEVTCCSWYSASNNEIMIVSGSRGGTPALWHSSTKTTTNLLTQNRENSITCCTSYTTDNDERVIIIGSDDGTLTRWNANSKTMIGQPLLFLKKNCKS